MLSFDRYGRGITFGTDLTCAGAVGVGFRVGTSYVLTTVVGLYIISLVAHGCRCEVVAGSVV